MPTYHMKDRQVIFKGIDRDPTIDLQVFFFSTTKCAGDLFFRLIYMALGQSEARIRGSWVGPQGLRVSA